jgi:nucleoside-diphosphate-sugar epimerase
VRLFCFGLGYTAARLGRALREDGWLVAGTARDASRREELRAGGLEAFPFPLDPPARAALEAADAVLSSAPPTADGGDPVLASEGDALAAAAPRWIGYLSSTGVYGDHGGAWVDEGSELRAQGQRARARATAEAAWLELAAGGAPVHVFRLAGIYGPGRGPLARAQAGQRTRYDAPGVVNRIHVDDAVAVLRASLAHPNPGAVYDVADGAPTPQATAVEQACRLLGVAPGPLVPLAEASPMVRSFLEPSRRVRARRIRDELGVSLLYPDVEAGLKALAADPTSPPTRATG